MMIDVDHFKRFNDLYGHDVGDDVLHMVAQTLGSNTRSFDTVARWGGEEFIAVLEKVSPDDLAVRAAMLCRLVEASSLEVSGERLSVTVSVGGSIAAVGMEWEAVVKQADAALYQAKANGRNRSCI
jgi:diguanylate cyclase (GGDEF)-like protein